jgi:hypothetical protein
MQKMQKRCRAQSARPRSPRAPREPHGPTGDRVHQCILLLSWCAAIQPRPSIFPVSGASAQPRRPPSHAPPRGGRREWPPLQPGEHGGARLPALVAADPILLLRGHGQLRFSWYRAVASLPVASLPAVRCPLSARLPACPPVRLSACRSKRAWAVKANTAATVPPQPLAGLLIHASCLRVPSVDPYDTLDQFNPFNPFNPAACTHACTLLTTHPLTHSPIHPLTPSPPTHHPLTLPPIPHPCHSCHSCRRPSAACRFAPFWPLSHLDHSQPSPPPTLHLLRLLRRRF